MSATLRIGTVWGIPIRLHWSLGIVYVFLTWSLAAVFFPAAYPELPGLALWLLAAATGGLFFGSILLHELGHARVALRNGLPVEEITLLIFGGVAQIGERARSPGVEFRVAVAGPLVSLILTVVFAGVWWLDRSISYLAAPSEWLFRTNLMLLLFNLIPGYPLDGGRMLRALVWRLSGNERRAARAAYLSGRATALGLMAWGVASVLGGSVADGLWLIFIRWFLQSATMTEAAGDRLEAAVRGVSVDRVMVEGHPRVHGRLYLRQLVEDWAVPSGARCFVVADAENLPPRGLVSLTDVFQVPRERWDWVIVAQVMTPWSQVRTVERSGELRGALRAMVEAGVQQLPVTDGGIIVGFLPRERVLSFVRLQSEVAG